jgi:hypothetical protein
MNTPEVLDGLYARLVHRGLPADYARRAAAEIADHHRDLLDELQAAGMSQPQASAEASRRLGDERVLIKRTIREYQRRYWCARWPLITFLLGPIPMMIAKWFAAGLVMWLIVGLLTRLGLTGSSDPNEAFSSLPVEVKFAFLIGLFWAIPAVVTYGYVRLARRAALGWQWVALVACILGIFAGAMKWDRIGPDSGITMRDWQTLRPLEQPHKPDFVVVIAFPFHSQAWSEMRRWWLTDPVQLCQLFLPAIIAAVLLLRGRQLALRAERLAVDAC